MKLKISGSMCHCVLWLWAIYQLITLYKLLLPHFPCTYTHCSLIAVLSVASTIQSLSSTAQNGPVDLSEQIHRIVTIMVSMVLWHYFMEEEFAFCQYITFILRLKEFELYILPYLEYFPWLIWKLFRDRRFEIHVHTVLFIGMLLCWPFMLMLTWYLPPQLGHLIVDQQSCCMWYLFRQMKHLPDITSSFFLSTGSVSDEKPLDKCGWPW